jgi:hypothetical protein
MSDLSKIALAIVSLAVVATLVVNGPNTARVVNAASGGFANSLKAAEHG